MNVQDYKAIIILFAPGQGGNHLANLISTSLYVEKRMPDNNYLDSLQTYYAYNIPNAHIDSTVNNVGVMDTDGLYTALSTTSKPYVIAGHIDETYYVYDFIKNLGSYMFITFENFNLTDLIKKRMAKYDESLIKLLYRPSVVSKLFETSNVRALDPADLFSDNPRDLLTNLSKELSLDLDLDFCLDLHTKWFNKIK